MIIRNDFEILKTEEIHKERITKMECKNKATQTLQNIIGFYGYPSSWVKNDRKVPVKKLELALSDPIINYVLGDFNFTEPQLDRSRPSKSTVENDKDIREIWAKVRDKYELVDSFRILNPKLRRYSHVKNNAKSRIDRIYITEGEIGKIQNTKFFKTPWEDHKIYKTDVFHNIDTGPGQWALNVKLLNDPTFLKTLENEWIEFRKYKNDFQNIKNWWDAAKNYMRTIAVSYTQLKSQIKRDLIKNVENQIEVL